MSIKFFYASRKVFFLVASFLILSSNYLAASQNRSFTATINGSILIYQIELVKDRFLLHEPVQIEMWLKNASDRAINPNFTPFNGWNIRDIDRKQYPSTTHFHPAATAINPGDSAGGLIGLGHHGITYKLYPSYFPEGSYTLSYRLFGDSVPKLTFTVVKPQGDEAKALDLYLKSFPLMDEKDFVKLPPKEFRKLFEDRIANLTRVADRYPQSVYAVLSLSLAASAAWNLFDDKEPAYQLNLRIIKEYSDPYRNALSLMQGYYEGKKNLKGFRDDLESIIKNSPDTKLVARAKRMLKQLESEKW